MDSQMIYALRDYAEAMHAVQCPKGKKCTWELENQKYAEVHQTAGIWKYGAEHQDWLRVATTHAIVMEEVRNRGMAQD